ncbi:MAG TPA: hypothetical protein DEV81_22435 [Cyanobacteria bacterium UBA11049]|nr:hypothetical protein [Cyanobacteria bacterium UBA11049]
MPGLAGSKAYDIPSSICIEPSLHSGSMLGYERIVFQVLWTSLDSIGDCKSGCPRCLTQHGWLQQNIGLYKDAGLFYWI